MLNALLPLIDLVLHFEKYLPAFIEAYGPWIYGLLFLIFFAETGFVVTPYLPGDSLLFVIGALAAVGQMNLTEVIIILSVAVILGDTVNYWIGKNIGMRIFDYQIPFVKRSHLEHTHDFFARYGGKTIVIARFVPIVRTFAPFLAGLGEMTYSRFIVFNVIGGIAWVVTFTLAGYLFGNIPIVKDNFGIIVIAIIVISLAVVALMVAGILGLFSGFTRKFRNQ